MSGAISTVFDVLDFTLGGMLYDFMYPDPPTLRLGEISKQTAKEGDPRVIVWGVVRPIGGNLNHCQEPQKRMVKQSVSGGKGGSKKKEQKVERVYRTYSISVCEGPITAFRRIWRNGKLAYDGRGTDWGIKNNPVFLRKFRLYTGAWSQMPDPALEAIWGVGQVPAYRGSAYMVCLDEDLTELGGAVAQWQFEVERAEGVYLTSRPYPVETIDSIDISPSSISGGSMRVGIYGYPPESIQINSSVITGGSLRTPLYNYGNYPPESIQMSGATITGGSLRTSISYYGNYPPESIQIGSLRISGGAMRQVLVYYGNYPPESLQIDSAIITGGTLG